MAAQANGAASNRLRQALDRPRITGFSASEETDAADHRFLLLRLGLSLSDCETVLAEKTAATVPAELRSRLLDRLKREREKLMRLGRARSRAYDLNRHIAVRNALVWIGGAAPA
ncbi:hypothetical protein [Aureimonas psammosilenae]|uniref:hypothetical protein n=1 Tax=Aureimonas psammosilenae TaxID=2495496 RepID=UPI001261036B|nr:hypothetical protein [Aureimonas psammosilenae]